jgi:hypothetical protein
VPDPAPPQTVARAQPATAFTTGGA